VTGGYVPDPFNTMDLWERAMLDLGDMELFRDYLNTLEAFVEAEREKCSERMEAFLSNLQSDRVAIASHDQQPWEIQGEKMWLGMLEGFANILRKSFFVSLYGWLESRLVEECHSRDDNWQAAIPEGNKLKQAVLYLTQSSINFLGESREWGRVYGRYRPLRNCIVHNEGKLDERCTCRAKLEKYIDREPALTLSPYDGEVMLGADFCVEALDTIRRFFVSVLVACGRLRRRSA
jgi:hypothetical protein